jgi:eukaryotic-like serine/threonine-protein kinase
VIGSTLDGKYRIERLLGTGAMGSVYEAEHSATGRRVAVKVISTGDLARDELLLGRFQREARAAGGIDTQHITQVLDAGVDRDSNLPFLVMEYLSGEDLSAMLKRLGPVSPDLSLRIIAQACLGLQKAHEARVVHRDIKPANLFLARRDAGEIIVKLLDFGIAKVKMDHAQDAETAALTRTGSMLGSPLYMSPEQARGNNKDIDHRADIWSLGVVLYQCLAGRTPWHDIQALGQLILAICGEQPEPLQERAPWVSPEIAAIVHRCMKRDPVGRFQTAQEMFVAIRPLLPGGWSITEDMLVPLGDTAKGDVAPKLLLSIPPPMGNPSVPSIPPPAAIGVASIPSIPPSAPGAAAQASTHDAATLSQSQAAPPQKSRATVGLVLAAVAALGAAGTYVAMSRPHTQASGEQAALVQTAAPAITAAPPPPQTATQAAAPPPVDNAPKRVKLVIMPPDATAEVEGQKVTAKDGIIEITGAPGSVHKVRLSKGKNEVETDVIVTESGAMPPKLELSAAPAPGGGGGPKPGSGSSTPPATTTAAGAAKPPPGIIKRFDD